MDRFNLQGYLKNNQLLNENIGGYVDIKPVNEDLNEGDRMYEALIDEAREALKLAQRKLDNFRGAMNQDPQRARKSQAYEVAFQIEKDLNNSIKALSNAQI